MLEKNILYGRWARYFFFFYNIVAYTRRFFSPDKKKDVPLDSPRILLCCWASLGDVLLATSVIAYIKAKWPQATIGFLCAPGSFSVIEHDARIDKVHQVPSWFVVGHGRFKNLFSLVSSFFLHYRRVSKKIRDENYDMSIELYPFFPSAIPLMRQAGIFRRVAFTSGGYDVWITDKVALPAFDQYLPHLYPALLQKIGIEAQATNKPLPCVYPRAKKIILHMGSSDPRKEWDLLSWYLVGKALKEKGYEIVLTGKGKKDRLLIQQSGLAALGENLCDQLSIQELSQLIQESALLISIDSFPVHLAASLGTAFIALYLYNDHVELWLPHADNAYLFIHNQCIRRCKEKVHPQALYLEEISAGDIVLHASYLLETLPS